MKVLLVAGTTVGVIGAGAMELAAQVPDDKWVQLLDRVGFPVFVAVALGLGFKAFINRVMNVYERIIEDNRKREDAREERERLRDEATARHNRIMRKLQVEANLLAKESILELKGIGVRVGHQTNVVRSESIHTAEVLAKSDESRKKGS